ncbi:MAG TPA: hypothetical protein VGS06_13070 [Streptosporangiaceae bacterium]|nr:hypothetical protein [Streptosporangiaceae bacterium]
MNTLEDRVRGALRARAEDFSASPDAWARIRARSRAARGRRGGLRSLRAGQLLIPVAAAAAVVAIVVASVGLSDVFGRAGSAPAVGDTARPKPTSTVSPGAIPSPAGPYSPAGPAEEMLVTDPPVSAVIGLDIPRAAGNANRAAGYFWIGYASPHYWFDRITPGPQFCNDTVNVTSGESSGFCLPLPQLGAGHLASVTGDENVGAGQTILQGAAAAQVTSMAAVLADGRSYPGVVKTGRGFPDKAWTVGYPPAQGVRLVFRDASGAEVATLSSAAPIGPPQVAQPRSGGMVVFRYPAGPATEAGEMTAYVIDGRVGFWSRIWGGYISPVSAADGPAADGIILSFGLGNSRQNPYPKLVEAFGYARADVTRIVLHLPGGQAETSTFTAWPGSGIRLWAVPLPTRLRFAGRTFTVTAYDAAGHVVQMDTLGKIG